MVLLIDVCGIIVDFIGDLWLDLLLCKVGLYLGVDWSECYVGICGVGICISIGEVLLVYFDDYFDVIYILLICIISFIYDFCGELCVVLDISVLSLFVFKES